MLNRLYQGTALAKPPKVNIGKVETFINVCLAIAMASLFVAVVIDQVVLALR